MADFLNENDLPGALAGIIESAQKELVLISPYIKLNDKLRSSLHRHLNNPEISLIIMFGKNMEDRSKSISRPDLDFFKQFSNVVILYEPRLHAKYYANESDAIITSMNLYDFSIGNNIEVGILVRKKGLVNGIVSDMLKSADLEREAFIYFDKVMNQAEELYVKTPVFEKINFGITKKWSGESKVELDLLDQYFSGKQIPTNSRQKKRTQNSSGTPPSQQGYCIRTGVKIEFNIECPFCLEAYWSWNKFANPDYKEKYCHFSGEPSNGQTSMKKPILSKNWVSAKKQFDF